MPDLTLSLGVRALAQRARSVRCAVASLLLASAGLSWGQATCQLPQTIKEPGVQGHLLNRHIWADLEFMVRDWTCDRGELYVITGPIYDTDSPETIGDNKVAVPSAFYKVAYEPTQRRAIALSMPNEALDSRKRDTSEVLGEYVKAVAEVEKRAGIRLFDGLEARDRNRIRRTTATLWNVAGDCRLSRK
jgi:endonuclease G